MAFGSDEKMPHPLVMVLVWAAIIAFALFCLFFPLLSFVVFIGGYMALDAFSKPK